MKDSPASGRWLYTGVALATSATLMLQLLQTRILSVMVWYHLAFFVISLAMFGWTAGAIWVYLRGTRFTAGRLATDLSAVAAAFALSIVLSLLVQLTLAPSGIGLASGLAWTALALALALPYVFSGALVTLALTRSPLPPGRVYAADMVGAAVGCLSVLALLEATDAPSAILWVSAMAAAAGAFFRRHGAAGTERGARRGVVGALGPGLLAAGLALLALANSVTPYGLYPSTVKGRVEARDKSWLLERWNSFSRVVVIDHPSRDPQLWGRSPRMPSGRWTVDQRWLNIDGEAATFMYRFGGDLQAMGFLRYDVTNVAYYLPGRSKAAVVGTGGGRDVLSALVFGVTDVTAVEINPIFVRLLTREPGFADYAGLRDVASVRFVADEARSWFARTTESFDIIQMTLIDTWAATGAGAFSLTENGLYTVEGWRTFLSRLTPRGVFTVSRWYAPGAVNETGRLVSLTAAALMSLGVHDVRRHLMLIAVDNVATLLVSRSPFTSADVDALHEAATALDYRVLIGGRGPASADLLEAIVSARSPAELTSRTSSFALDLTPPTDDRPFFFNQLPLQRVGAIMAEIRRGFGSHETVGVAAGNLSATATLLMLLAVATGLVTVTLLLPARRALRDAGTRLVIGGSAYFLFLGLGYMAVEIGLLQRMSVFLGHPIYALSVVLFTLILATGMGSLLSEWLVIDTAGKLVAWAVLTAAYTGSLPFWLPEVMLEVAGASLAARAAVCVAILTPAGLLMGFGFPTGLRLTSALDRRPTPWFWGINGAAGVLSAILAVACSIAFGIGVTLLLGAACYLLLIPAAVAIGFRRGPRPSDAIVVLTEGRSGA
jgi:hypothetical protein